MEGNWPFKFHFVNVLVCVHTFFYKMRTNHRRTIYCEKLNGNKLRYTHTFQYMGATTMLRLKCLVFFLAHVKHSFYDAMLSHLFEINSKWKKHKMSTKSGDQPLTSNEKLEYLHLFVNCFKIHFECPNKCNLKKFEQVQTTRIHFTNILIQFLEEKKLFSVILQQINLVGEY